MEKYFHSSYLGLHKAAAGISTKKLMSLMCTGKGPFHKMKHTLPINVTCCYLWFPVKVALMNDM